MCIKCIHVCTAMNKRLQFYHENIQIVVDSVWLETIFDFITVVNMSFVNIFFRMKQIFFSPVQIDHKIENVQSNCIWFTRKLSKNFHNICDIEALFFFRRTNMSFFVCSIVLYTHFKEYFFPQAREFDLPFLRFYRIFWIDSCFLINIQNLHS